MEKRSTVCVTGATSYIGSWLVRKLLHRGYIVYATLRNSGDESKVQLLKKLEGADERLRLFEADLYDAEKFELAINGSDFVFLLASTYLLNPNSQYKDTTEASLAAMNIIMGVCEISESVKRVINTASVMSASPRKEDDFSFKNLMDESCWTPLHCPFAHAQKFEQDYIRSKTSTEKEFLAYNTKRGKRRIKVVSLVCALVGGNGILEYMPGSISVIISPLSGQRLPYKRLKLLQEMLGSVPLVHIDDDIVDYYKHKFPNAQVLKEVEGDKNDTIFNSTKLLNLGFKYKYSMEQILDGSVEYVMRVGSLTDL